MAEPPAPDGLGRRDEQDRHQRRVIVPVRAPVRGVGRHEPQRQAGQRQQGDRRAEGGERRGQQQHHDRLQLRRPAAGRLPDQRQDGEGAVRRRPRRRPSRSSSRASGLKCGMITVIATTDQNRPHATRNSPPHSATRPSPHRSPRPGLAREDRRECRGYPEQHADRGDGESLVLLDEHQRHRPRDRRGGRRRTSAESENASSGTARAISWKSKSIICCRPQENAYANPISRPVLRPVSANPAAATGNTDTAVAQRLEEQQRRRRGEEPEERGEHADRDLEVVAQEVEPGREHVDDRRVQLGQLLDVLGVDAEVLRAGRELQQPEQRDDEVRAERQQRDRPGDRVPPDAAPAPPSAGAAARAAVRPAHAGRVDHAERQVARPRHHRRSRQLLIPWLRRSPGTPRSL